MSIQVNIFEAGSVPTAQELVTLINELNTSLDESVTLTGEQSITGVKTFLGSKLLKFKQSVSADKLGFTLYDYQSKEVGNFEYDNKNNFRLLALGNYVSAANQEVECNIGFKIYNKLQSAAYRLLCPLAGNAKNSIPSLSETYTNFYMPLVFTNGALSVTADNNGKVDLSTLIGSGGGGGDISGLATVATTGDYNDLLNRPVLFSGNYNDLTNKPTLFSGSYGDLTDKPTLFSGDYNDLTNKPTIPTVDLTKAQADNLYQPIGNYLTEHQSLAGYAKTEDLFSGDYNDLTNKPTIPTVDITKALADSWYQPIGNYALKSELFSGSYNDLTDKPSLFSGNYNDLTNKPSLFSGSYNDLTDKPALFSGSYNDLSDKPTIPAVPAISTNITSDAASDTKTASPKAVKDFVEGKGYLTQHQDISGKADQTDLEALEDRVETLEQSGGGGTTQYSYLKLIPDLNAYTEASTGEVVKYVGQSGIYVNGVDYERTSENSTPNILSVPSGALYIKKQDIQNYYFRHVLYPTGNSIYRVNFYNSSNNLIAVGFSRFPGQIPQGETDDFLREGRGIWRIDGQTMKREVVSQILDYDAGIIRYPGSGSSSITTSYGTKTSISYSEFVSILGYKEYILMPQSASSAGTYSVKRYSDSSPIFDTEVSVVFGATSESMTVMLYNYPNSTIPTPWKAVIDKPIVIKLYYDSYEDEYTVSSTANEIRDAVKRLQINPETPIQIQFGSSTSSSRVTVQSVNLMEHNVGSTDDLDYPSSSESDGFHIAGTYCSVYISSDEINYINYIAIRLFVDGSATVVRQEAIITPN